MPRIKQPWRTAFATCWKRMAKTKKWSMSFSSRCAGVCMATLKWCGASWHERLRAAFHHHCCVHYRDCVHQSSWIWQQQKWAQAREVGIRKSIGSLRRQLILQFMGESMIIAFISFAIAVLAAQLLLPYYNILVEKKLFIDYAGKEFWLFSLGLILVMGFVAGSYPAFYLSGFNPQKYWKANPRLEKGQAFHEKYW